MDADYYTVNQGIHPDFVAGLKAIMAGAFQLLFQAETLLLVGSCVTFQVSRALLPLQADMSTPFCRGAEQAANSKAFHCLGGCVEGHGTNHCWSREGSTLWAWRATQTGKVSLCLRFRFSADDSGVAINAGMLECRALLEQEERLDDMTVDEALAAYPTLAQEIKNEIEAGEWSAVPLQDVVCCMFSLRRWCPPDVAGEYDNTNAGHKLEVA
jgi:hypothetical protein